MSETNVKSEPRVGRAEKNLEVLPSREVRGKILETSLGDDDTLDDCIGIDTEGACRENIADILSSLVEVAFNVHCEPGRLRNGQSEVESHDARNTAETDEQAPAVVDVDKSGIRVPLDGTLVCRDNDEGDESSS